MAIKISRRRNQIDKWPETDLAIGAQDYCRQKHKHHQDQYEKGIALKDQAVQKDKDHCKHNDDEDREQRKITLMGWDVSGDIQIVKGEDTDHYGESNRHNVFQQVIGIDLSHKTLLNFV